MKVKNLPIVCYRALSVTALICLVLLLGKSASAQSTIYIDPSYTGSTQNGSIANPFKSWTSVTWTNGTTYLQKAGTTYNTSGSLIISSKGNITLSSYGTGAKPKIISSGSTSVKVIDITSCSNMIISNLEVASTNGMVTAAIIIDGTGSANNLIDNCILRDVQWGIRILTTSPGNKILNCEVFNTQDDGIYIKDTPDIEIGYCNVHDVNLKYFVNPDQSYSAGDNIQIASTNGHDFYVHHNILDHSSTGNKFCFIAWGNNYSGVLEHNTMIGNASQVTSCVYLSPTTESVTMRYNSIRNGNYGIYSYVSNFNVYYNNFSGNKTAICVLNNYHLLAENNVFYNTVNTCISGLSGSTVISKNNIFYLSSTAKAYSTNGSLVSNNNTFNIQHSGFINGHATLSSWQSATGQDLNSMVANPLLTNPSNHDFSLQPGSPCINAGVNCGYNQDFFGNQVPQGSSSDIGYFEFSSTSGNLAPVISNQNFSVTENSANGTIVGQVVASDPNPNQTITFSISGGNTNNSFSINSNTGVISVANGQNLNFENAPQYQLQVTVQDNIGLSSSAVITINISNTNENPVINDQGFNINENSQNGTIIGTVIASDPDQSQLLTFSIVSGNSSNIFTLNPSSGVLSVNNNQLLNYELTTSYTLLVKVQDNGTGLLSDQASINVSILDLNESPVVGNQTFNINSTVQNGYVVGTISAIDPDHNQALNYQIISGNLFNIFNLNYSTGILTVTNNAALSTITEPINLNIKVTDNGTPTLSSSCVATINVNPVQNNNPPVIISQNFTINENSQTGSIVGQIIASDPNQGQTLTYTILSGNTSNAFNLSSNGQLTVANGNAINFELSNTFSLVVKVTDNGNPNLSSQAQMTISVINVNDTPAILDNQLFVILSFSPNGTVVGIAKAIDEDYGQNLTFALVAGNLFDAFAINQTTGEIIVANSTSLKKLSNRVINLTISVADNGNPILSSSGSVEIKVLRRKEFGMQSNNEPIKSSTLVFPNPSLDGKFTLRSNEYSSDQKATINIIDMHGNLISQYNQNLSQDYSLDLSDLPKGIYMMQIMQNDNKEFKKLIIQ